MFKISFQFLNKNYTGTVQKINHQPVQFVVFGITPWVGNIPEKLVYISHPQEDQLTYRSFDVRQIKLLSLIGETNFHDLPATKD